MDMRTSKYSEKQIIDLLGQAEAGMRIKEIGPNHGFSDASNCKWRSNFRQVGTEAATNIRAKKKPRLSTGHFCY
jgi:putative transposase